MLEKKVWKSVKGYEGSYKVSNFGDVKSVKRKVIRNGRLSLVNERILKPGLTSVGYPSVMLHNYDGGKTHLVHKLVAVAFLKNVNNLKTVNHKNGIKIDNAVSNLEWCSYSDNNKHAHRTGLINAPRGEKHKNSKLTEKDVVAIRRLSIVRSEKELGKCFGVTSRTINNIKNRDTWKHIKEEKVVK